MHHRLSIVPYVLLSEYASEIGHGGWGLMHADTCDGAADRRCENGGAAAGDATVADSGGSDLPLCITQKATFYPSLTKKRV